MQPETQYVFNGIGYDEARDRYSEHRTGVPALGQMQVLLFTTPVKGGKENNPFLAYIKAWNTGENQVHLRTKHGGTEKTQTDELLVGNRVAATNVFRGGLQFSGLVAGSVLIEDGGALADIVDDGLGNLQLSTTLAVVGTVDYINGTVDFDYGAAITLPVTATYNHGDDEDFAAPQMTAAQAAAGGAGTGGTPENIQPTLLGSAIGRVNPGSVSISEGGVLTFVDDGKGNIIQTNTGDNVVGSIDYATGAIVIDQASAALAGTITTLFLVNPFAAVLNPGGGRKIMDLFSQFPELTNQAWGLGTAQDPRVSLHGECTVAGNSNLVTQWGHFSEEPFRVEDPYSGFPAGGHDNDPRLLVNSR